MVKNIVILASGGGSNAESIIQYFAHDPEVRVSHIFTNKSSAGVLARAERHQIPSTVVKNSDLADTISALHQQSPITAIILAGYLRKIADTLVQGFPDRIINIHPALLPKYGGKGMYGIHVHTAVKAAQETESGMTIHLVNEEYDKGRVLMQGRVALDPTDTVEDIASKVLKLEHYHYPRTIHQWLSGLNPPV